MLPAKIIAVFFFEIIFHTSIPHVSTIFCSYKLNRRYFSILNDYVVRVTLTRYIPEPYWDKAFLYESSLCLIVDIT